jgi:hypothetical protein
MREIKTDTDAIFTDKYILVFWHCLCIISAFSDNAIKVRMNENRTEQYIKYQTFLKD